MKEMKLKLSPKEYKSRYDKRHYLKKKDRLAAEYKAKVDEKNEYIEEIYRDVYDQIDNEQTVDEYYLEKFKQDNVNKAGKYWYSRRASHLSMLSRRDMKEIWFPIRIVENYNMNSLFWQQEKSQSLAYQYIKPYINEIDEVEFMIAKKQRVTNRPMRSCIGRMLELVNNTNLPKHQICEIASALKRNVYIASEIYLGRISFLFWDCIVTSMGQMFFPSLENNIGWLTKDTVDEIHDSRVKFHKYSPEWDSVPIAMIFDSYLIRLPAIKIEWRENYWQYNYYVVPYWRKNEIDKNMSLEQFRATQKLVFY